MNTNRKFLVRMITNQLVQIFTFEELKIILRKINSGELQNIFQVAVIKAIAFQEAEKKNDTEST